MYQQYYPQQPYYGQPGAYQPMGQPAMNMYGAPAYSGYGGQQPAQPVMKNFLTPAQIAELQANPDTTFPLKLSRQEWLKSQCLHKNEQTQTVTLEKLNNGNSRCTICGEEFHLFEPNTDEEDIKKICQNMVDLLQTIKTFYLAPPNEMKDIFLMIGFIERIPYLWQAAVKSMEQATNFGAFGMQQQDPNANAFQVLGSVFGGGILPGTGFYQQPVVPPMAMYSQPGFAPQPTPGLPQAPVQQPQYNPNQQYGFSQQMMQQPTQGVPANGMGYQPPPGYPNPASNPIGYVEQNQMATQNVQVGGQQQPVVQQPPQQPIAPPANPNIQPPPAPPTPPSSNSK